MKKNARGPIARVAVIISVVVLACALLFTRAKLFFNSLSVTDTQVDVNAVEHLLKLAQTHPSGELPQTELDASIKNAFMQYSLKGQSECWTATQDAASRIGNSYTISATDPFRESGRDVDNTLVEVKFRDGSKIAFTFYQQTMVGCDTDLAEAK